MSEGKKTAREIIEGYDGPAVRIMEVCGTHTHEIFRLGIRKLLPKQVELISGPGCPVCVTPISYIDEAVYLALEKSVTICTFGDLVRVPGSKKSLADARSEGGKIHIVYSPADAERTSGRRGCILICRIRDDDSGGMSVCQKSKRRRNHELFHADRK